MSSSDTNINVVSNPYFSIYNDVSYQSYVNLAFDTYGSAFNMRYMRNDNTPYSPTLITKLFEFAVIQDAPCKLDGRPCLVIIICSRKILYVDYIFISTYHIRIVRQSYRQQEYSGISTNGLVRNLCKRSENKMQQFPNI